MATDPIRRIRRRHLGHAFDLALDGVIAEIAALAPNTETPYVTVTADWSPAGGDPARIAGEPLKASQRGRVDAAAETTPHRPARTELRSLGDAALAGFEPRTAARLSVEADLERIAQVLETDLPDSASGAVIVANHGAGVFIFRPLGLPVKTALTVGTVPAIRALVRVAEDNEPYGVLVADQVQSVLTFFVQHYPLDEVAVTADGWPRKQAAGGLNQQRYQARADERIDANAKVVAEQVQDALNKTGVEKLVTGGSDVMLAALGNAWHDDVRRAILDEIRVAPDATSFDLAEQVYPIVTGAERDDEFAAVVEVEDAIGQQTLGRAGAESVGTALARGQVELLVMNDDFAAKGWVDPAYALAGVGDVPAEHPAGGDPAGMFAVELGDEFVRMALGQKARVEIVHTMPPGEPVLGNGGSPARAEAATKLDELGGVAVVLRYTDLPTG